MKFLIKQLLSRFLRSLMVRNSLQHPVVNLNLRSCQERKYEAFWESKDTKDLNMYNIFNLQKWHCE
jgi:hypothetical protein